MAGAHDLSGLLEQRQGRIERADLGGGVDLTEEDAESTRRHPLSNSESAFDVAALGVTRTTFHGGWTGTMVGSSVAAPHVAGLAAVIFAKAKEIGPLELSVQDVKQRSSSLPT